MHSRATLTISFVSLDCRLEMLSYGAKFGTDVEQEVHVLSRPE
jgi:hypothetical protein